MPKISVKEFIGFMLRYFGVFLLLRGLFLRNKVTILVYHNPQYEVFKQHLEFLSRYYKFITLEQLIGAIYTGNATGIPAKSLVITLDDGHMDNYKLLPIFKEYSLCPTIYLCSHLINTNRAFWFSLNAALKPTLKRLPNQQRLEELKKTLGHYQQKEYGGRQVLNCEEIREMLPYVDFQAHSKYHPVLTTCSDVDCLAEIREPKRLMEDILNIKVDHFSYPNGDYSGREIKNCKENGYKSARTCDVGWNDLNSDPYRLRAMSVSDDSSINVLCGQVCGIYGYFRYLRQRSFNGRKPVIRLQSDSFKSAVTHT
jgi:peptidoglycan/xylan/chitin deacetylase (PgdA/CDA1 family)